MKRAASNRLSDTMASWRAPLIVTAALILIMAAGSFVLTEAVNRSEEEQSFVNLEAEVTALSDAVYAQMTDDRDQLEIIATLVAHFEDLTSPEIRQTLASYNEIGTIDHLELLLPDNTVVTTHGDQVDASEQFSFADIAAQGAHVSNREMDVAAPDEFVVRNWVPVMRDGQTIAMLCGVIKLGTMPESLVERPYNGQAAIYLIEAETGDFLVDTWHPGQTGNIWQMGEREMAPGYDADQLRTDLTEGRSGHVVFESASVGEHLYFYFQPCGINDWQVALSVPESVVFSRAISIRETLNVFLAFEALCFVVYFFWALRYVRRETSVKQRQLDTINYLYEVEKLLFNAHVNRASLATALERISQITSAEYVCLWLVDGNEPKAYFARDREGFHAFDPDDLTVGDPLKGPAPSTVPPGSRESAERLVNLFKRGHRTIDTHDRAEIDQLLPVEMAHRTRSLIAVPIEESDGTLEGILVARNAKYGELEISLLKNVEPSFAMFRRNLRAFREIKIRGEVDQMTSLLNRNRFEADMPRWAARCETSLSCVYLDANGLHELNNAEGHRAGDRMLRTVAHCVRETFGRDCAYRIGGDEFVAIAPNMSEEAVERCVRKVEQALARQNISVSTGSAHQTAPIDVDKLLKDAEARMYQAKRAYYEQTEHDRRSQRLP